MKLGWHGCVTCGVLCFSKAKRKEAWTKSLRAGTAVIREHPRLSTKSQAPVLSAADFQNMLSSQTIRLPSLETGNLEKA